jgi:pimeloyl-ACP methyl ester carboxylesterase
VRRLVGVCLAIAVLGCGSAHAQTITATPCPHDKGFFCGAITVPLDYSGRVPGTIALHFAEQRPDARPVLLALTGGPGQSAVLDASRFVTSLAPALPRYRLVVLDQRGTGQSGALDCAPLQRLSELSTLSATLDAQCATQIGPQRAFYATSDSVRDIDILRQAIQAPTLAVMGVSYGTFVAQQYARTFPHRVSMLILDSVVPPRGIDAFSTDTYGRMSRVLHTQCERHLCAGITKDPVADLAALDQRLTTGPLRGTLPDGRGVPRAVELDNAGELANLVVAGDSNAFLQPAIPGAIVSALHGDYAPLLRLRRVAVGPPVPRTQLSAGLNIATFCEDSVLPYSVADTPLAVRPAITSGALAAEPAEAFGPIDRQAAFSTSIARACEQWPRDWFQPASDAPLPDVPALILAGELDLRTPMENAAQVAAQLPRAHLVDVAGVGHDELDSDTTTCVSTALAHFVAGRPVGRPCLHAANQVTPYPVAPASLAAVAPVAPGTGDPGRVAAAAALTVIDAYESTLQRAFAGFTLLGGGGLRGGRYNGSLAGTVHLIGDSYVPGVRVTGELEILFGQGLGVVSVDGPGNLDGQISLDEDGSVSGRIGGHFIVGRLGDGGVQIVKSARSGVAAAPDPQLSEVGAWFIRARRAARGPMEG